MRTDEGLPDKIIMKQRSSEGYITKQMIIDRKKIISLIYARILYTISVDLDGSDVKEKGN